MVVVSKVCKPDNFELYSFLKRNFSNVQVLHSNFLGRGSFLEEKSLMFLFYVKEI